MYLVFRVNLVKKTNSIEIIVSMQWNNQIIVFHYNCKFLSLFLFLFSSNNDTVCMRVQQFQQPCTVQFKKRVKKNHDETKRRRRRKCVLAIAIFEYYECLSTAVYSKAPLQSCEQNFSNISYKIIDFTSIVNVTTAPVQGNIEHARRLYRVVNNFS